MVGAAGLDEEDGWVGLVDWCLGWKFGLVGWVNWWIGLVDLGCWTGMFGFIGLDWWTGLIGLVELVGGLDSLRRLIDWDCLVGLVGG